MKVSILSKISVETKREMVGVLLVAFSFLTFISLVTYSPTDLTRLSELQTWGGFWEGLTLAVHNQGGLLGALLSSVLYYLLGYCVLVLPILGMMLGIRQIFEFKFDQIQKRLIYAFWGFFVLGSILSISSIHQEEGYFLYDPTLSGYFGHLLAEILYKLTGLTGAYVLTITILIMLILAVTPLRLASLKKLKNIPSIATLFQRIKEWPWMKKLFQRRKEEILIHPRTLKPERLTERLRKLERENSPQAESLSGEEDFATTTTVAEEVQAKLSNKTKLQYTKREEDGYEYPALSLLDDPPQDKPRITIEELNQTSRALRETLATFGIGIEGEIEKFPGPIITRFEFKPASGVKVNQVVSLADDLALAMQAKRIRIVAPIPGKAAIGVEIPNRHPEAVYLKEIITSAPFRENNYRLPLALGKDISGQPYVVDLARMPHLLIAGATGSGKSVCMNCLITSLLYKLHPEEVRFVMIDPKMLELSIYSGIPHLEKPVVVSHKVAERILQDAVIEMENRYKKLAKASVRNIEDFNLRNKKEKLPYLIILIDELADLMMSGSTKSEVLITRLAQMARAVGIHLILATQRPSVDVITGLIKANFSTRIAFQVASKIDSRTILDANGAEKLLGMGDMLFLQAGLPEPARIHGALITGSETEKIVNSLKEQNYLPQPIEIFSGEETIERGMDKEFDDELLKEAAELVVRHKQGSVSLLQRRLGIGYQRAARLIDMLEARGVVGPYDGSKARQVLVDLTQLPEKFPSDN
jgi:S-DNA-T family DNA segregation ATPase FtsK/SpoIIIE